MKEFSRFFTFIITAIIFIVLFDLLGGYFLSRLQKIAVENSPSAMVGEYTMHNVNAPVVIIGSSRAKHHYVSNVLKDSLNVDVYNCGLDGCFMLYQTCMINGILQRYAPEMIIWDIEPLILSSDNEGVELDRLNSLFPFYETNNYVRTIVQKRSKFEKYKLYSKSYRYNSRLLPLLYKSVMPDYPYENGYAPISNIGYSFPTRDTTLSIYSEHFLDYRKDLLEETIELCRNSGVDIVFSFSPRLSKSEYRKTRSFRELERLSIDYGITMIDSYHDDEFMSDSTLFKDQAHLNDRGAHLFSSGIARKIAQYLK